MELTVKEKSIITFSLVLRLEYAVERLNAARYSDDYWMKQLEEANGVYFKLMGCNASIYDKYIEKKNQLFVRHSI